MTALRCDACGRRPREEWRIIVERARLGDRREVRIWQHACGAYVAVLLGKAVESGR